MSTDLRPLSSEEIAARDAALDLAADLVGISRPLTIDDVQSLYDACLDHADVSSAALLALGVSFGEQIVIAPTMSGSASPMRMATKHAWPRGKRKSFVPQSA